MKIYIAKKDFLLIWELLERPQLFYELVPNNPYFYSITITNQQLQVLKQNSIWFSQSGIS